MEESSELASPAATPPPPVSSGLVAQQELIAVLRANLAESMKLNEEFEDDLRVAVQCMADCEAQREADVAALEAKIGAMHEEQHQQQQRTLSHCTGQAAGGMSRASPPPPPEPPVHAMSSTAKELESRATELFNRAGETKFRHLDSLTNNREGDDDGTGEESEVTLRLRVPVRVPPAASARQPSASSSHSRQQLNLTPSRIPATRSKSPRPRSTSADPSTSEFDEARQPAAGLVTADTERTIRQLQLEVVHLRQRLAMAATSSLGRGRAGSPTSTSSDTNAPMALTSQQQAEGRLRARLATAVQDTLLKGLAKATMSAKDIRSSVGAMEGKVRHRQVCSSNARASFVPLSTQIEGLVHLLDGLRLDGLAILRNNCTAEELRHVGAAAGGARAGSMGSAPTSQPLVASPNDRRGGADRARPHQVTSPVRMRPSAGSRRSMTDVGSSGGSLMSGSLTAAAASSDPASAKSPKWVLVDSRTIKVAGCDDDEHAAPSDSSRRGSLSGFDEAPAAANRLMDDADNHGGATGNDWVDGTSVA